ncbi:MAG TPA: GAF domain-containing protein [Roseiflexaceae bacterium]|nr:GAF domain-containing protein [Roseiflexaceae bacterium]
MHEPAHILIVDDDPGIRRMFQLLLQDTGYRVSLAGSGEEALSYLELVTPDLILMDLVLPGISGQEVTERVKADERKPFIPILLVTARGDQESKVMALDAGADDFLVKPVDFTELLARVRAMLRLQRSQRSLRAEQRKTELLLHLTRELGTTLDLDQLLTHFLDRLADAVGAIRASIILTSGGQLRLFSSTRNRASVSLEEILRNGIAGWVLRERRPAIIEETRTDARWVAVTPLQRAVRSVAAVPIIREDRALGAITLVHHTPGYFTEEHLELLNSVAAQSAITLENAELFQLTQRQKDLLERRAEELARINQMSRYLAELMSPDQLVRLVAHLIHHTFGYPQVALLLREEPGLVVRAVAGGQSAEALLGQIVTPGEGAAGQAVVRQAPVLVADTRAEPRSAPLGGDEAVRSELAVPIATAREVFGVLHVMSAAEGAFGEGDVRLLSTLASQLGVALDNARLFDTEQRRVRQLDRVNNLSLAITAKLDPHENLRIAADAIATIFEVQHCGIVLAGAGPAVAARSARPVAPGEPLRFALPLQQIAQLVELHGPQLIPLVSADERLAPVARHLAAAGIEALALAPLMLGERRAGMVVVDATGKADQFLQGELTLLETVASLIAQVMENARLYREVENERSTLGAVLRGAADPILLIDPHDQLLLANRAAEERLGLAAAGRPLAALLHQEELLRALWAGSNGLAAQQPPATSEVTLAGGETYSISVAPVRSADNALIGRVAVLQDITAIKELERREQERLRSVFRRYVSPQVVEEVLAGGGDFGEPVEREVVVLIADLRGYTALTEGMPPRVLVEQVLNRYFTAMTEVLYRHGGTIDKFLGDGIIGVFGVPIPREDDVQRSLMAAVDLQRAFADLRRTWRAELGLDIGMGVGMGYGRAVVGNIGSAQRLDYTVIGDVVNTASRLNGLAQPDQILLSYHLVDALPPGWRAPWGLRPIGPVALKGKHEPHMVYEIEYKSAQSAK